MSGKGHCCSASSKIVSLALATHYRCGAKCSLFALMGGRPMSLADTGREVSHLWIWFLRMLWEEFVVPTISTAPRISRQWFGPTHSMVSTTTNKIVMGRDASDTDIGITDGHSITQLFVGRDICMGPRSVNSKWLVVCYAHPEGGRRVAIARVPRLSSGGSLNVHSGGVERADLRLYVTEGDDTYGAVQVSRLSEITPDGVVVALTDGACNLIVVFDLAESLAQGRLVVLSETREWSDPLHF
ncbi:hypothetical protein Pelo_8979 [Pelomyxa schiedti]|nr:hypothetical protein Pelo_8979 [Pelomyxa schiedti]